MSMPTQVSTVAEKVVPLADDYAQKIVASLPTAESEEMLTQGIAGALLSFFAAAVVALSDV